MKNVLALFTLALLALLSVGCCGKEPIKYNVTVSLDEEMRQSLSQRKLEVHLVGINETQHQRWENYSMSKYWQPGDPMPNSLPTFKMEFDPANSKPQTITIKDKIWDTWLAAGANRLYVLTLLPGMVEDAPGDKDPRRQILPLPCYRWLKRDKKIDIVVQKTGLTTMSLSRPEK
jgi:hypothetical protein